MSAPLSRGSGARRAFEVLAQAPRPLLFLDLDGTLAPIVDRPGSARVPPGTSRIVQRLRATGATVVLVSGRAVAGVRHVAQTPVDAILGDHGACLFAGGRMHSWLPASKTRFARAAGRLERLLEGMPGVRFQRKERSLAIHLRLPRGDAGRTARRIAALLRAEGLRVLFGHRVLDAQLPGVDKGRAVLRWLRFHPDHDAVFYAGDDTTDEDALHALKGQAVTVAVGPRPHYAALRTSSPKTLAAWLARLVRARESLRREGGKGGSRREAARAVPRPARPSGWRR